MAIWLVAKNGAGIFCKAFVGALGTGFGYWVVRKATEKKPPAKKPPAPEADGERYEGEFSGWATDFPNDAPGNFQ